MKLRGPILRYSYCSSFDAYNKAGKIYWDPTHPRKLSAESSRTRASRAEAAATRSSSGCACGCGEDPSRLPPARGSRRVRLAHCGRYLKVLVRRVQENEDDGWLLYDDPCLRGGGRASAVVRSQGRKGAGMGWWGRAFGRGRACESGAFVSRNAAQEGRPSSPHRSPHSRGRGREVVLEGEMALCVDDTPVLQ
jgi:hypothetical protein